MVAYFRGLVLKKSNFRFAFVCVVTDFATFHRNFFEGTMPAAVCALSMDDLTSDCLITEGRDSPPYVECDANCCTQCF